MKAKTVSGYYVVNYGIKKDIGHAVAHKNGTLRIKADYNAPSTHRLITDKIYFKHPGWSIVGYCPAKPLANTNRPSAATSTGETLAKPAEVKLFWAVMRAQPWSALTVGMFKVLPPPDGPNHIIPVFDTREQAVAWCDGDDTHVQQMSTY